MRTPAHVQFLILSGLALVLVSCGAPDDTASLDIPNAPATPSPYLYVWAGDAGAAEGDSDFLAVVDADPESPTYGSVLGTAPVGSVGNDPHHAEPIAPSDGLLFANGFNGNRTFLFDLSSPAEPTFVRELDKVAGFEYLHSFYRLENSHVLATIQRGDGSRPGDTGGLAEFETDGNLVRVTSAADPDFEGDMIRPYALEVFPEVDRVLTTSMSMMLQLPSGETLFARGERDSALAALRSQPARHLDASASASRRRARVLYRTDSCRRRLHSVEDSRPRPSFRNSDAPRWVGDLEHDCVRFLQDPRNRDRRASGRCAHELAGDRRVRSADHSREVRSDAEHVHERDCDTRRV